MKTSTWMRVAALAAAVVGLLPVGCGDEDSGVATASVGRRGESCRETADCAAGLACVGQLCTVSDFRFAPTGKECVRIECRTPEDCCPELSTYCLEQQQLCDQGSLASCDAFTLSCLCNANKWACEEDQCVEVCQNRGALCTTFGICDGSRCVECLADTDCLSTQICTGNECVAECEEQSDCPYFNDCQDGACVEVGCSNDRECIAYTRNVLAFCDPQRECQVPCATDLECDTATSFDFRACINRLCQSVGCETDDECRVLLRVGASGNDFEAECRVKAPPESG